MIYVASPYSHELSSVQQIRYIHVLDFCAYLLKNRFWCYSPIIHCHKLANTHSLPTDFEFWKDYAFHMLKCSSGLFVLAIDGWKESKGVTYEIDFAKQIGISVVYWYELSPSSYEIRKG